MVLDDPQRSVSRWHASIRSDGTSPAILTDLNSANGTFLNGRKITGPTPLRANDGIRIGPHEILYREETDTSFGFSVQAGAEELDSLQRKSGLLDIAGEGSSEADNPTLRALELLHEVSLTLARTQTVDEVKEKSVELLFKIEPVHRACVMLWDEEKQAFQHAEVQSRATVRIGGANFDPRNLVLSHTILEQVRKQNRPLLIRDVKADSLLRRAASIVRAGIQAAFCSPLTFHGRFLGVLYADNLAAPDAFSSADFRTFTNIAAQAGLALANAMARTELSQREVERAAMRLYLPPQVMDMISASDGLMKLGGVSQPVTVLYADIRGFSTFSEQMDASEVVQLLNEFFTEMTSVIFEAGGTLDKFIGDCVMALFGAPVASEDSPDRALRAAIGMQQRVRALNATRLRRNLRGIQIGIGIHTGMAVVGNIGSADRMQYTAIGDTVNIAARLVGRAVPGQILISEDVRRAITGFDQFEHLGETELKGRAAKVEVFSVIWDKPAEQVEPAAAAS